MLVVRYDMGSVTYGVLHNSHAESESKPDMGAHHCRLVITFYPL